MAEPTVPPFVKLICGMISADPGLFDRARELLREVFGATDVESETMDFDFTHYYDAEMGSPLYRRFVAFAEPVKPDVLAGAKRATNEIESRLAGACGGRARRPVNLDVGYVGTSKLVLASMKDFAHRVYLGGGVYAEVTLLYRSGRWERLGWTFPDYASPRYHGFLTAAREALRRRIRREDRG